MIENVKRMYMYTVKLKIGGCLFEKRIPCSYEDWIKFHLLHVSRNLKSLSSGTSGHNADCPRYLWLRRAWHFRLDEEWLISLLIKCTIKANLRDGIEFKILDESIVSYTFSLASYFRVIFIVNGTYRYKFNSSWYSF